jgi:hypothetical protein
MPVVSSYDYAIIRLVPFVEREEFVNVGVILFCRTKRFLEAATFLDEAHLDTFAPRCNKKRVKEHLDFITTICAGDKTHPIGQLTQAERFHWLVTPRSTSIQVSTVHTGLCVDPAVVLKQLLQTMVKR